MDNEKPNKWKVTLKNVLKQFKNKTLYCNQTSILSMSSEIKNQSVCPHFNVSSHNVSIDDKISTFQKLINGQKVDNDKSDIKIQHINNSISDFLNKNKHIENVAKGSRSTLASISYDNSFIQNDLYKSVSANSKNSTDSLFLNGNNEHFKHKQPIMGKTALLKKSNLEHSDSFIVHSIILNKYEDILNHYVNRMYKRRISRMSASEDEFSENSTVPRYSPSTISSIGGTWDSPNYFGSEKKYYSADDLNVESSKEHFIDSSNTCYSYFNNETSTSIYSEYDPNKFLANAIGDLASLQSESPNFTTTSTQTREDSVGTSRISSLISRTNSFCSSVKRNLMSKKSKKSCSMVTTQNIANTDCPEQYTKELSKQNSIIFQISKALNYCKSSKDLFIGRERLEAEKILLVATVTKEALINEINTIEFDTYRSSCDPRCTGGIEISQMTFNMKEKIDPEHQRVYDEYFLIVVTCGKNVLSSDILAANNGVLSVQKFFGFRDLLTDFEITLCVYSLRINKKDYNSHDQSKCPSPKSIFKCNKETRHFKSSKSQSSEQIAFIPIGRYHITNSDILNIKDEKLLLKLQQDPLRSSLRPFFELQIQTTFELTNRLPGFLTIGHDNGKNCLTWNRRWCILDGILLKYWNYPSEENLDPIGQINLSYCSESNVTLAERSLCARPRTLSLPIKDGTGLKKLFLSADTQSDLQMWESELNFVVQSLIIWGGIKYCSFMTFH